MSKEPKDCWLCPHTFETKRDLKVHMTAKPHARMAVVCPWCSQEKTFNRVIDLRGHVTANHRKEVLNLPSNFLGENNGFWLSLFPEDYRRLVNPTERSSLEARKAREIVLRWTRMSSRRTRSKDSWLSGWDTRDVANDLEDELDFDPDYEVEIVEELREAVYAAYEPTPISLNIISISLILGNVTALFEQGSYLFKACISDDVFKLPKAMASIARRISLIKPTNIQTPEKFTNDKTKPTAEFSNLLGIPENLIKSIQKPQAPAVHTEFPSRPVLSNHHPTSVQTSPLTAPSRPVLSSIINSMSLPYPATPVTSSSRHDLLSGQTTNATTSPIEKNTFKRKRMQSPEPPRPTETELRSKLTTKDLKKPAQTTSSPKSTTKNKAQQLISMGCMPLFPPARRQWAGDEAVVLEVGDTTVRWPPKEWQELTSDQKLLMWEFTAMSLATAINKGVPPTIDRFHLLDTFNFIALPGTGLYKIKKAEHIITKSRYYNYEQLRHIINKDGPTTKEEDQYVLMMEHCVLYRETKTQKLIDAIDQKRVKLRLE